MNIQHTLPEDQRVVLTCTSNSKYIEPLSAMIKSLHVHNTLPVVCRLVNCTSEEVSRIEKFNNTTVLVDNKELSTKRNICNPSEVKIKDYKQLRRKTTDSGFKGVGWLYSQEAAYCSNIKYNTINQLLNNNNDCVVYMDVDTIIRGDIDSVYDHVQSHDVGMFICPEEKEKDITVHGDKYIGWHAGIIVANNTPLAKKFMRLVEHRVHQDMCNMEADEDEFDYVYRLPQFRELKIKSIDKTYKDSGPVFSDDSLVWSGQAENKESNQQYIEEFNKHATKH